MNNERNLTKKELVGIHMISSYLQITVSLPISHPIDTIKTRIQTREYNGNFHEIFKQIKQSGFRSMYKGYFAMYLNLVTKQPAKLAVYEHIKNPLYAGLATGFVGLCVGIPMSYIKTNYQVNDNFKLRNITKFGFFGFFKSFVAWKYEASKEMVGNTAFYGLYRILNTFRKRDDNNYIVTKNNISYTHFALKSVLNKITPNLEEQRQKVISLENGAIAGFLGTYLSYPIDTMKSYKQTKFQTKSFSEIFNEIYLHPNPSYRNFWKGVSITAFKHGVIGGIGMLIYESIKPKVKQYVINNY